MEEVEAGEEVEVVPGVGIDASTSCIDSSGSGAVGFHWFSDWSKSIPELSEVVAC